MNWNTNLLMVALSGLLGLLAIAVITAMVQWSEVATDVAQHGDTLTLATVGLGVSIVLLLGVLVIYGPGYYHGGQ